MPKIFWVQFGCNIKTARFWAVYEAKIDENEAFLSISKGLKIPRDKTRVGSSPTSGTTTNLIRTELGWSFSILKKREL